MTLSNLPDPPAVVLDTNGVLDWLVFREATVQPIARAIASGTVRWLACLPMRAEFERTLGYPNILKWQPERERLLATFDCYAVIVSTPPSLPSLPSLRCSDPDDQVFVDLAVAVGARWLLTHDRALLQLQRSAQRAGVVIVKPSDWQPQ